MDDLVLELLPALRKVRSNKIPRELVEDCANDFYLKIKTKTYKMIDPTTNPKGLLYRRFLYYMSNYRNQFVRRKSLDISSLSIDDINNYASHEVTPEKEVYAKEREKLAQGLLKHTTAIRARVIMTALEHDSIAEASRVLGANLETTKRNYYRGLQDIKEYLLEQNYSNISL